MPHSLRQWGPRVNAVLPGAGDYHDTMATRAILVHDLEQARTAAAAAAELGVPLTLASAPGAGAYLGPGWTRALGAALAREFPGLEITLILDCADKPGHALAALRMGAGAVRFTGGRAVARKLKEIAAAQGAAVMTGRLSGLDLLGEPDPAAACLRWLARP